MLAEMEEISVRVLGDPGFEGSQTLVRYLEK